MSESLSYNRQRVVILGASNVSRGIGTLVGLARAAHPGPLELLVAAGHGRSYGAWSSVLGRSLPGIRECGLWQELAARPAGALRALVTDIGNDLLYEQPPEWVAEWVKCCLSRLMEQGAEIVLTELPLANLARLSPARFRFFRALFVPRCRLDQVELTRRAIELNERLLRLAAALGIRVITPRVDWYGIDPIHIRYGRRRRAWREVLATWASGPSIGIKRRAALRDAVLLRTRAPAERRWGRLEQRRAQPVWRWSDGSTIGFY